MKFAIVVAVATAISGVSSTICGQRNRPSTGLRGTRTPGINYIVAGHEAIPHEFPWQVTWQEMSMIESEQQLWTHSCGASIVNEQWVISAAHCHFTEDLSRYRIIAGIHRMLPREKTAQIFGVEQVFVHPAFHNSSHSQHDLMLLKIAGRFEFDGRTVAPICLPESEDDLAYNTSAPMCTVSGWGKTVDNAIRSNALNTIDIPIVSNEECAKLYRHLNIPVEDTQICAGLLGDEQAGVCQGDSGGPLVCPHEGRYKLTGVISFGSGCGQTKEPAIFTRVAAYMPWITGVIANNP